MLADVLGIRIQCRFWSFLAILAAFSLNAGAGVVCPKEPAIASLNRHSAVRVLPKYKEYTQGLVFMGGDLYESTGLEGHSKLQRINLRSFKPEPIRDIPKSLYTEGLAVIGRNLFQLTYRNGLAFKYDLDDPKRDQYFNLQGTGWGLTQHNGVLVKSDGTNVLEFLDPNSLSSLRKLKVHLGSAPLSELNELESAQGYILANIFYSERGTNNHVNKIALINPESGCVERMIDLMGLRSAETRDPAEAVCKGPCVKDAKGSINPADFAANGIAYDSATQDLYITGKNWPYIFVFKFPIFETSP